jgi:hypothetical protein
MLLSIPADAAIVAPAGGWASWSSGLTALHLIATVFLIVVIAAWARHGRRRLVATSGVVTMLAVASVFVSTVEPRDIPIDWITIMHEGLGYKGIAHLYTIAVHAGVNFHFVVASVASGSAPSLFDVVWLNMLLAIINAVIFLHLAFRITSPAWAIVWTLVFALNPATFLASFSELPSNLLELYLLVGFVAWAVLIDPQPQPTAVRVCAYVLCAILTLLVALTRLEVALIGVVALAAHAVQSVIRPTSRSLHAQRFFKACERPLAFLSDHPAVVAALSLLGVYLSMAGLPWGLLGRSESAGLYPFNSSFLSLFVFLPMLLLPLGVSIGIFFGFVHASVRFWSFGGLALSLFVLVRTYFAAQDQYFETGRYLTFIFPALFLLGL